MVRLKAAAALEERAECGPESERKPTMAPVVDTSIFAAAGSWLATAVVSLGPLPLLDLLATGGWSAEAAVECAEPTFAGGVGNAGPFIWGDAWLDTPDCTTWLPPPVLAVLLRFCPKLPGAVLGSAGLAEGGVGRARVWPWGFSVCLDV